MEHYNLKRMIMKKSIILLAMVLGAFIIYLCGFVFFFKLWLNRYLDRRDEKKAAKGGEK